MMTISAKEWLGALNSAPRWMKELDQEFALATGLLRARAAADLTQDELAELAGIKRSEIIRLEGGGYVPSVRTLERLAAALHVTFEITEDEGLRVKEPVE